MPATTNTVTNPTPAKANAYVETASSTNEYRAEKLKLEKLYYKSKIDLPAQQIEEQKLKMRLLQLQIRKKCKELSYP